MNRFCLLFLLLIASANLRAQTADPEWPCIQVLVPEVVTAVFWPEVIEESEIGLWKKDPEIRALAEKLGDLDRLTDTERELISNYVESVPDSERLSKLNILADGIVSVANSWRATYINGIKRYTRQQIAISEQIEKTLNELEAIGSNSDSGAVAQRAEIEETLKWHERVYDQRENAIISLCDRPVELEEVLSDVMREVSFHLP